MDIFFWIYIGGVVAGLISVGVYSLGKVFDDIWPWIVVVIFWPFSFICGVFFLFCAALVRIFYVLME